MCINGHHNKVGGSEASTGMAWTPPKRRGRAQRRVSCEKRSWGGSWFLGYVRRRDEIANEKIAAAARRTIPEGSRTIFVVGAYRFGANFPVQPPNFPQFLISMRINVEITNKPSRTRYHRWWATVNTKYARIRYSRSRNASLRKARSTA